MQQNQRRRRSRKVYAEERQRLLKSYESGEASIPDLAKQTGRNPRTIAHQLQLAVEDREKANARTELYRQALLQHNESLLQTVRSLRGRVVIPIAEPFFLLGHFPHDPGMDTGVPIEVVDGQPRATPLGFAEDEARLYELTREHLSTERQFWNSFDAWFELVGTFAVAASEFGLRVGTLVAAESGLPLRPTSRPGEGIHQWFVSWACRLPFEEAAGILPSYVRDQRLDIAGNQLHYGGSLLATASQAAVLTRCRALFERLQRELRKGTDVARLVNIRSRLESGVPTLRRKLGDVILMGMMPGRCTVCKALGR